MSPDKKRKRKPTKKRIEYPPEAEAAWFAIKEFINVVLCSYKIDRDVYPFNTNEVLSHYFSKTGAFDLYRYSKKKYSLHLLQLENHYFRCNHNAKHSTGFHRSDKIAKNSVLFEILGVDTKRQEYEGYYVILCKVDIDGHNGERDCEEVALWLNNTHFKQSYWEPSTGFSGKHGYIKIAIPIGTPFQEVHDILNKVFNLLDIKRELAGYIAPIDVPCGLPPIVTWDNSIDTPKHLSNVSRREYRHFCSLRRRIDELKKNKQDDVIKNLDLQISDNHHYDDILSIVETPVPASIKSSQCGKLPRFNRTYKDRPSLDDIKFFYNLEYYDFSFFVDLLDTLEHDPNILSYTPSEASPSSSTVVDIYDDSSFCDVSIPQKYNTVGIPGSSHSDTSSSSSHPSYISPCSDTPMAPLEPGNGHSISFPSQENNVVSSSQEEKKDDYIHTTTLYPCNHCVVLLGLEPKNKDFEEGKSQNNDEKEEIIYISNDANRRTGKFIAEFLRDYYREHHALPEVIDVEDIVCDEYRQKYGTGPEDQGDRKRIISMLDRAISTFKPEKLGTVKYEQRMFIPYIKEIFEKRHYKDILQDTSAGRYRPKNHLLDLFAGYCYTHLSRNRELTLSTYDGFKNFCGKYRVVIKYNNICLACRLLFEHYGWLEKIDADYEPPSFGVSEDNKMIKKNGKSMAYTLTDKFPFYSEFVKAVGEKNVNRVRAKGMASVQNWDSMDNTA